MKIIIKNLFVLLIAISTTGCAGMIMDAISQSERSSDKTFAQLTPIRKAMSVDNGRVFLYRTNASTRRSLSYGIGIQKNTLHCNFNEKLIKMYWEMYLYFDVEPGKYKVSCYNGNKKFMEVDFNVDKQTDTFVRVDVEEIKSKKPESTYEDEDDDEEIKIKITPVLVDAGIAKVELNDLNEFIGDKTKNYIY